MFSTDDGVGSLPSPSSPSPTNLTRVATPDLLRRPATLMPSTSSITTVDAIKETERENAYLMRAYREKEEELEELRTAAAALEEKVLALSAQLALSSQERQQRDQHLLHVAQQWNKYEIPIDQVNELIEARLGQEIFEHQMERKLNRLRREIHVYYPRGSFMIEN